MMTVLKLLLTIPVGLQNDEESQMSGENTQAGSAQQTPEDKFFGKKTVIDDMIDPAEGTEAGAEAEKITVETVAEGEGGIVESSDEPKEKDGKQEKAKKSDDEELESYSKSVQDRINKLTWEREEAKRNLKKAEDIKAEAVRYAQTVNQQNKQQAEIIATGEARLVEQIKNRAALAVESASQKYREAYTAGDTEKIIAAQKELNIAQAEQLEGYRYEQDYQHRVQSWAARQHQQQQPYAQHPPQPAPQQPPAPTPKTQDWVDKNPWFGQSEHRDMTAIAYAEHERLTRDEGIRPDTDEYYEKIDEKVRHHFPNYFSGQEGGSSNSEKPPPTVVASGERNSGRPRTVRLEPHQVALARQLGLTPEQYAEQVLKESSNG
jgi:hypothetical protein